MLVVQAGQLIDGVGDVPRHNIRLMFLTDFTLPLPMEQSFLMPPTIPYPVVD